MLFLSTLFVAGTSGWSLLIIIAAVYAGEIHFKDQLATKMQLFQAKNTELEWRFQDPQAN
jgi:hypothetical protein